MQNNTAFVYFKLLITKLTNSKLSLKKVHFWELSALFNQLYALNSYVYHLVVTVANPKPQEIVDKIFSADWM